MSTISVSNLSDLYDALKNARGGETIELAGGNYGDMVLNMKSGFDLTFPSNVTITSADPENPAVFSGMQMRDAANLTFDGVTFDYTFQAGDNIYDRPFAVSGSENITIRNSTFDGDLAQGVSAVDDGYGYAIGLSFRDSAGVTVENNEFFEFHRGGVFAQSSNVTVTGNDVHDIRMDGFNFTEIKGALIEDNYIHDFRGSLQSNDHSDMIQFWTAGTDSPSTDVIIRGNHLDIGDGSATQSIFMRNEVVDRGQGGTEMFYQNFRVEDNVIVNGHAHGITVGSTNGLIIKNNSVLHADGDKQDGLDPAVEIPRIYLSPASTNVTVQNNITSDLLGYEDQADWSVRSNAFVQDQDPAEPGYYDDVFVTSSLDLVDGVHHFRALESGMLGTLQAGASATHATAQTAGLTSQFHVTASDENASVRHFDAGFSQLDGQPVPDGAQYTWAFGDGFTASGAQVTHAFANGGAYDVALTITLPNGNRDSHALTLDVGGALLVSYATGAPLTAFDAGVQTQLQAADQLVTEGVKLGGTTPSMSIEREHIAPLLTQDEFRISMNLTADTAASAGEIARLHGSFILSAQSNGELLMRVFQDNGTQLRIETTDAQINDTTAHEVDVKLNDNKLEIWVDGTLSGSAQMTGTLASTGSHDLTFGNQFTAHNFDGTLSAFEVAVNESQFDAVQHQTAESAAVIEELHYAPLAAPQVIVEQPAHSIDETMVTLTGEAVSARIARSEVDHVLGEDAFAISLTLSAANTESFGEVMRLHQSFVASVTEHGELYLRAFDEDGTRIRLTTDGASLNDTLAHDITIAREDGILSITVNGDVLASSPMATPLADVGRHDLTFGNIWTQQNFEGAVSGFELSVPTDATDVVSDATPNVPQDGIDDSADAAFDHNIFADAQPPVDDVSPDYGALATARLWAERGYLTPEALDRFESMLATPTDAYFE